MISVPTFANGAPAVGSRDSGSTASRRGTRGTTSGRTIRDERAVRRRPEGGKRGWTAAIESGFQGFVSQYARVRPQDRAPQPKVARHPKLGPRVCAIPAQSDATKTDRERRKATAPDVRGAGKLCAACAAVRTNVRTATLLDDARSIARDYALRVDFVARFARRLGTALVVARDLAARDFAARG